MAAEFRDELRVFSNLACVLLDFCNKPQCKRCKRIVQELADVESFIRMNHKNCANCHKCREILQSLNKVNRHIEAKFSRPWQLLSTPTRAKANIKRVSKQKQIKSKPVIRSRPRIAELIRVKAKGPAAKVLTAERVSAGAQESTAVAEPLHVSDKSSTSKLLFYVKRDKKPEQKCPNITSNKASFVKVVEPMEKTKKVQRTNKIKAPIVTKEIPKMLNLNYRFISQTPSGNLQHFLHINPVGQVNNLYVMKQTTKPVKVKKPAPPIRQRHTSDEEQYIRTIRYIPAVRELAKPLQRKEAGAAKIATVKDPRHINTKPALLRRVKKTEKFLKSALMNRTAKIVKLRRYGNGKKFKFRLKAGTTVAIKRRIKKAPRQLKKKARVIKKKPKKQRKSNKSPAKKMRR